MRKRTKYLSSLECQIHAHFEAVGEQSITKTVDMGKGSDNKLPKEVFAALPKDPDQQLQVAQQITQIAVSGRVAKLEAETSSLRQKVAEKDAVISGLQARVVGAETTLTETTAKLAVALEGQVLTFFRSRRISELLTTFVDHVHLAVLLR